MVWRRAVVPDILVHEVVRRFVVAVPPVLAQAAGDGELAGRVGGRGGGLCPR